MPQLDFDGANSKISADKLQGQSGTSVTVPTGHTLAGTDANSITINGVNAVAVAPSTSGNVLTSNGSAWASTAPAGGGKCLQVVQDTLTSEFSSNATSYTAITGLAVTITPSSGSKILLTGCINIGGQSGAVINVSLFRDSTELLVGDASASLKRAYAGLGGNHTHSTYAFSPMYLDTHGADGSTAITYTVKVMSEGTSYNVRINRCHEDAGSWQARSASSLVAIEIGA